LNKKLLPLDIKVISKAAHVYFHSFVFCILQHSSVRQSLAGYMKTKALLDLLETWQFNSHQKKQMNKERGYY